MKLKLEGFLKEHAIYLRNQLPAGTLKKLYELEKITQPEEPIDYTYNHSRPKTLKNWSKSSSYDSIVENRESIEAQLEALPQDRLISAYQLGKILGNNYRLRWVLQCNNFPRGESRLYRNSTKGYRVSELLEWFRKYIFSGIDIKTMEKINSEV